MFRGNQPQGFTIIEVMIFLAVSGVLFLSALSLINNQQNNTEFFEGIHEFYSQMQSLTSDSQIGNFLNYSNFSCTAASGGGTPQIGGAPPPNSPPNSGCTYVGHVIQFAPKLGSNNTDYSEYIVYPVIGRQFAANQGDNLIPPVNLNQENPVTIGSQNSYHDPTLDATTVSLPPGLIVSKVTYTNSGSMAYDSLIGLLSNYPQTPNSNLASGSSMTDLVPVPSYISNEFITPLEATCYVSEMFNDGTSNQITYNTAAPSGNCNHNAAPTEMKPSGGVEICLQSTGLSNMYGIVTIGGNLGYTGSSTQAFGNPLSVQLTTGNSC